MKTYETWEVMKMLSKNPKLIFETVETEYEHMTFFIDDCGCYALTEKGKKRNLESSGNLNPNDKWQLVREPVPAWEAIKAWKENLARIKCIFNGKEYFFDKDMILGTTIALGWICSGTWYILEDPTHE